MTFTFSSGQVNDLAALLLDAEFASSAGVTAAYTPVYAFIYNALTDNNEGNETPKADVDSSVWEWVAGARQVNSDTGYFANFIRSYTADQYFLRYGESLSDVQMQQASDAIAQAFAKDIVDSGGLLPSLDQTAKFDAGSIASKIFNDSDHVSGSSSTSNFSPWAGSILFAYLGDAQPMREWILPMVTVSNPEGGYYKALSGTYDLVSVAAASHSASGNFFSVAWQTGLGSSLASIMTQNSIGFLATQNLLSALRVEANQAFENAYGLPDEGVYRIGNDLPLYPPGDILIAQYYNHPNFILGTLNNDSSVVGTTDVDIIQAGMGNDNILASQGNDLIDGDSGADQVSYLSFSGISVFEQIVSGTLYQNRFEVDKSSGSKDYLYSIEKIIATDANDIFHLNDPTGRTFNGAGGSDTLGYDLGTHGLKIDISDSNNQTVQRIDGVGIADVAKNFENVTGSSDSDIIIGSDAANVLSGGDGNDELYGGGGADTLYGGAGNDDIFGDDNGDLTPYTFGADNIYFGTGLDVAMGGGGADIYHLYTGDGLKLVLEHEQLIEVRAHGFNPSDVHYSAYHNGLIMWYQDLDGTYTALDGLYDADGIIAALKITFDDGSSVQISSVSSNLVPLPAALQTQLAGLLPGSDSAETINGTSRADIIHAGQGNDIIFGGGGSDFINAGTGDDQIHGGAGNDVIYASNGADVIYGDEGNDYIFTNDGAYTSQGAYYPDTSQDIVHGGDGDDHITLQAGNDIAYGDDGNDTLLGYTGSTLYGGNGDDDLEIRVTASNGSIDGGAGNDVIRIEGRSSITVRGGTGDDDISEVSYTNSNLSNTYLYSNGDGKDKILDYAGSNDIIQFGTGISHALSYTRIGKDLIIGIDQNNSITIQNQFDPVAALALAGFNNQIETVKFSDNSTVSLSSTIVTTVGTDNNDILSGITVGGSQSNIFTGAKGDDQITGGTLADTYIFNKGDGFDTVTEQGGFDTIKIGPNISLADLIFTKIGNDLNIHIGSGITVKDFYSGGSKVVEQITFADNSTYDLTHFLTVPSINHAPVAQQDDFTSLINQGISGNILSNNGHGVDLDPDGSALVVTTLSQTTANGGQLILAADGTFTYTPASGFFGTDSFVYTIGDSQGATASGTVTLTITSPNHFPNAFNDDFSTNEDTQLNGNLFADNGHGVDSDPDGDTLAVTATTLTTAHGGSVTILSNGDFSYTPIANYHGADSFGYTVVDPSNASAAANVNITVASVNDTPIAASDDFATSEDNAISGNVLQDHGHGIDSDVDGDALVVQAGSYFSDHGGSVSINAAGDFTYTPFTNYNGLDSFTYQISDGNGGVATGSVNITIAPVNDNPIAQNDAFSGVEDNAVSGNVQIANGAGADSDVDGDSLIVQTSSFTTIHGGAVVICSSGDFTYTPAANYNGADSFNYSIYDGNGGTASGIVNISLQAVNDAPDAKDDNFSASFGQSISANLINDNGIGADQDPDGDTLHIVESSIVTTAGIIVAIASNGAFTYTPAYDFAGSDSFVYTLSDGNGGSDTATSTISISAPVGSILGTSGSDTIIGTTGADTILAVAGNDVVNADAGNDVVYGGNGDDTVDGGAGNDTLDGGNGSDTVTFASATSAVTVSLALVTAQATGGSGTDTIANFENLAGSDYNDILSGNSGDNVLNGGSGIDTLSYANATAGVTVNLSLASSQNTGGAGTDTISNFENVTGSNYNDTLSGNASNNVLIGGSGTDTLSYANATAGVTVNLNTLSAQNTAGAGTDTISGFENLIGSAYNDILTGDSGDNIIDGGSGNDVLAGGAGIDTLSFVSSQSAVNANLITNSAVGNGNDNLSGFENITGSTYDDILIGNSGANTIIGGTGNDTIDGGAGNDTLDGGAGIDTLTYMNDTNYVLSGVTVSLSLQTAQNTGGAGTDIISGFENLTGSNQTDTLSGNSGDNIINGGASSDTVSYWNASSSIYVNLSISGPQSTGGAGNDTLISIENLTGSDYDDILTGLSTGSTIKGGAGNDFIYNGSGNDGVDGGAGIDTLSFANSTSAITVNLGTTTSQVVRTSIEIDTITNVENVVGSNFNDVVSGSSGNNVLNGGAGVADMLSYSSASAGVTVDLSVTTAQNTGGAGVDTISNFERLTGSAFNDVLAGDSGANLISGGLGNDIMDGGAGIDTLDYSTTSGQGITLNLGVTTAQNTVGAGTDTVLNFENLTGTSYDDILIGSADANSIDGGLGNDVIDGGAGNDILSGGAGVDTLSFASSSSGVTANLLTNTAVGNGNDFLSSFENIMGSSYDDLLIGFSVANVISGGSGNDTIDGGYGNDTLDGGSGVDTLTYMNDTNSVLSGVTVSLSITTAQITGGAGTDIITGFENLTGTNYNDILSGDSGDNIINGANGFDTVNYSNAMSAVTANLSITTAQATVGAGMDTFVSMEAITGSNYDDVLTGDANGNTISGGNGNDIIDGGAGTDVLNGGAGLDTLSYASATAAITLNLATTTAQTTGGSGSDTVSNFENITGSNYNDNLTGTTGDNTIEGGAGNDIMNGGAGIDTLSYAHAASGISASLAINTAQNTGGAGTDTILNFENIFGSAFNDTLIGDGNSNIINGGGGSNTLAGGGGADIFAFEANVAVNQIQDFSASQNDKIDLTHMLSNYDSVSQAITDFVQITETAGKSIISVDVDGAAAGHGFEQVATLYNATGLTDVAALVNSGTLIV